MSLENLHIAINGHDITGFVTDPDAIVGDCVVKVQLKARSPVHEKCGLDMTRPLTLHCSLGYGHDGDCVFTSALTGNIKFRITSIDGR